MDKADDHSSAAILLIIVATFVLMANLLCFFTVPWRWLRIVIMLLICMGGLAFIGATAFGMAMGAGHGSHHGPDPRIFGDVVAKGGIIISIISLLLAWIGNPAIRPAAKAPAAAPAPPIIKPMQSLKSVGKRLPRKDIDKFR